jgi:hypothetical protein
MSVETLPEYLNVSQNERGGSLPIDFETYHHLARTALAIIENERLTIGLYRLADGQGCALDVFGKSNCLTIVIQSSENRLFLYTCPMDSPFGGAVCLLKADNSDDQSAGS